MTFSAPSRPSPPTAHTPARTRPAAASGPPPARLRLWAGGAAAWTLLYVGSKVHYALEGRLGVTGGPEVAAGSYDAYGPGDVAGAQWANAAVGLTVVLLFAFCRTPRARRLPRWAVLPAVGAVALMAAAGAVGMLVRAAATDAGGAVFGGYCLVWTVLAVGTLITLHRSTGPAPATGRPKA
ncbi:hypothetical protein ACFO4E_15780 [Nocardiopsis mangrovi]|uniref:DUF998 domain-containing protein n=1 Tax=Nocardiopsis mangrovi TaxID=1179818 RepID=A0ABV9E160_9ACTN